MKLNSVVTLETNINHVAFGYKGGGFPTLIAIKDQDGHEVKIINSDMPPLTVKLGDGRKAAPFITKDFKANRAKSEGAEIIEFNRIPWRDEKGVLLKDFYLSLKWEFWSDGAVFCDIFVFYATLKVPVLRDFKLSFPLDFSDFDDVKWAVRMHPEKVDATIIQAAPPERFLPMNESRNFNGKLFTQAGFNAMRKNGPSFYTEFFLEGNNSLFNHKLSDTASSVKSMGNGFEVEWNFQKTAGAGDSRPLHWRNRFGFLLRSAPIERNHPPYSLYQYIDNFQRVPDETQIKALAEAGAQVLVMHDCWRLDTQNGGIPYDEKRFRKMHDLLNSYGIRLVLYVRGNELSVIEDSAAWFDTWLKKDFDGLYMDYGGPAGFAYPADENFTGGRTAFRQYYKCMKALRERIGKKGLFFSHTGTFYSGLATGFFDGYTSGEGERGILVKGRREHEYFSMSAVSPGMMWTAAFPEYSSKVMTPFLAATGQAPHQPIGKQIESSSLRHPPVPGISDGAFRELLYVWSLLGDSIGYKYYTDYNSRGLFSKKDSMETAHCVIVAPGGKYGVFLLSNCSGKKVKASFSLSENLKKYKLFPISGYQEPAKVKELAPYEVAAAIIAHDSKTAEIVLKKHPRPIIKECKAAKEYRAFLKKQGKYRNLPPGRNYELNVFMPSRITSHEQTLWNDLYDIVITLREKMPDGKLRNLGYVSKRGIVKTVPNDAERLHPGERSCAINLKKLLGPGRHELQMYSEHLGESFYSFLTAELSDGITVYPVEFMNELETDRAILHWTTEIEGNLK